MARSHQTRILLATQFPLACHGLHITTRSFYAVSRLISGRSNDDSDTSHHHGSMSTGAIAGIVAGIVALLLLSALLFYIYGCRQKQHAEFRRSALMYPDGMHMISAPLHIGGDSGAGQRFRSPQYMAEETMYDRKLPLRAMMINNLSYPNNPNHPNTTMSSSYPMVLTIPDEDVAQPGDRRKSSMSLGRYFGRSHKRPASVAPISIPLSKQWEDGMLSGNTTIILTGNSQATPQNLPTHPAYLPRAFARPSRTLDENQAEAEARAEERRSHLQQQQQQYQQEVVAGQRSGGMTMVVDEYAIQQYLGAAELSLQRSPPTYSRFASPRSIFTYRTGRTEGAATVASVGGRIPSRAPSRAASVGVVSPPPVSIMSSMASPPPASVLSSPPPGSISRSGTPALGLPSLSRIRGSKKYKPPAVRPLESEPSHKDEIFD